MSSDTVTSPVVGRGGEVHLGLRNRNPVLEVLTDMQFHFTRPILLVCQGNGPKVLLINVSKTLSFFGYGKVSFFFSYTDISKLPENTKQAAHCNVNMNRWIREKSVSLRNSRSWRRCNHFIRSPRLFFQSILQGYCQWEVASFLWTNVFVSKCLGLRRHKPQCHSGLAYNILGLFITFSILLPPCIVSCNM